MIYSNFVGILNKYAGNTAVIKNVQSLFANGNKLNLLAINKTALTSFQSLSASLQDLKSMRDSLQGGTKKQIINHLHQAFAKDNIKYEFVFTIDKPFT